MCAHPPAAFRVLVPAFFLLLLGCQGPATRARDQPAALRQLSAADQQLVLAGRIREGLGKDAVAVAWGKPSRVATFNVGRRSFDLWFYTQVQYGVAGGYFGVSRDFRFPGGHARYDDGTNGTGDFYVTPPYDRGLPRPETEVPYKKAVFEHGRVVSFETLRGA